MLAAALLPVAVHITGRTIATASAVRLQHRLEQRRTGARDHRRSAQLLRLLLQRCGGRRAALLVATDAVAFGVIDERLLLDGALAAARRGDLCGYGDGRPRVVTSVICNHSKERGIT